MSQHIQCWEAKKCERQPGGAKVGELGICPAATDQALDGINSGKLGGRMCWASAGTFCGGTTQGSFATKALNCVECDFFKSVREEEGQDFQFLVPGHEYAEVSAVLRQLKDLSDRQEMTIRELSTPVLQIWEEIIVVPIIGVVDTKRSLDIMDKLLSAVVELKSRYVILDLTGVDIVDTKTADYFLKIVRAAQLLGAQCVITGIQPAVAQTLVAIGVDLAAIQTLRNLQVGLKECLHEMNQK